MTNCVEITVEARVANVVLNRPDKHNALNKEMFTALAAAGDRIVADKSIRAVVVSGSGEHFCAGIDTSAFGPGGLGDVSKAMRPVSPSPANVFQRAAWVWQEVPVPVICAITGVAFGGGMQIALGADIRYAAPSAKLSIMEIKWGLIPDMAISAAARHVVPRDRLKELAFTGRVVGAEEALEIGLVSALHEDPLAVAQQTAAQIAGNSPHAIRAMKKLFNDAWQLPVAESLALEASLQSAIIGGENQREAVQANLENRVPDFKD